MGAELTLCSLRLPFVPRRYQMCHVFVDGRGVHAAVALDPACQRLVRAWLAKVAGCRDGEGLEWVFHLVI